ncbi:anti-sigma factor [Promicromonospora sp. Populi]|uniref:anti-sigma factor family protein n=1 Tax=Promicromonospora sp. Populi TaxID=3239420 RepID=UPI0034E22DDB
MNSAAEGGHGDRYAEWDAAYVLGALSPSDRRAFEHHLAECDACRGAVAELAGLPGLLSTLTPAHAESLVTEEPGLQLPDGGAPALPGAGPAGDSGTGMAQVIPLANLASVARRSRFRRRTLGAVAASALLIAGVAGGSLVARSGFFERPDDAGTTPSSEIVADAQTIELLPVGEADMHAEVVATPTSWGTKLEWSCEYPPVPGQPSGGSYGSQEPIQYELVVVGRDGERTVAGTWLWSGGEIADLDASSHVPLTDVDRIEITLDGQEEALASATL